MSGYQNGVFIGTDNDLYTFESEDLYQWFGLLGEKVQECLIVGHNPALTRFCNALSGSNIKNIPTCGYVQLVADEPCRWLAVYTTRFTLKAFLRLKALIAN